MTKKEGKGRLRSGVIGSRCQPANKHDGWARVPRPCLVDAADLRSQGWDFRDLAAFLLAQDADWVRRSGA